MKQLERNGGKNLTVADPQQWTDLYFRHNFNDKGMYPSSGTQSASPDIIPNGPKPLSDPNVLVADGGWGTDYGSSTNADSANYIYLRGANLGTKKQKGRVYLYYSPGSLLLWPHNPTGDPDNPGWADRPLKTNQGAQYVEVDVDAGARFVTKDPLLWVPKQISGDHYCLVGRLWTADHPNDIPSSADLQKIGDFAKYISEHPNLAWRNVVTVNPSAFTQTQLMDYDQGSETAELYFNLNCYNFPDNSDVEMSCATSGPNPPIYAKGTVLNPKAPYEARYTITILTTIPANFRSKIAVTWYSNGKNAQPGMKFQLDPILTVPDDHPLSVYAKPLQQLGIPETALRVSGPRKGIRMGSQTYQTPPAGDYRVVQTPEDMVGQGSRLWAVGVSFKESSNTPFSQQTISRDVEINRTPLKSIMVDEIILRSNSAEDEPYPDAHLTYDGDLATDLTEPAKTQIALTVTKIPEGSQVWIRNVDGTVPIAAGPATVNNDPFTLTTIMELPAEYQGKIRAGLKLKDGTTLPDVWQMRLDALTTSSDLPEANQPLPVVFTSKGPKPGTLLGRIIAR